jgi:diguanylate cyclase (GGDEF)-like protein/PAS domain S-box-containing protein
VQVKGAWHSIGIVRDITERKRVEEKLQLAANVFIYAREGIMITSTDGVIIDVNDAFCEITGYSRDEILGRNPRLLSSGLHGSAFYAEMWRNLIEKGHWSGELWNRRKNGVIYAELATISAVLDDQGNTRQYVALFSDITPLKEHEKKLEHIAHYDALTGLPTRVLLADRLHLGMSQVRRRRQRLAVAFFDLDGFKAINDNYGHEAGDQLLIALANNMAQTQREGDTLARLGGDEFVAVLLDLDDIETSVPILTRLLAAVAQPMQFGDITLQVSASLGVTFYPQAEDIDADQLLRQADQAMYQAKLAGKNRYHVFDAEQDSSVRSRHVSLEGIRHALTEREFVLYYQPKVNMRSGKVIGVEALIRWQHPERGLLLPDLFLPVINNHPLAIEVGDWVIDTALTQMALWHAAGLDIQVSVNVGARQLQQADFVERLRSQLTAHPEVMPCCFELEVLETSALEDLAGVSRVIEACRKIGVLFALDDFGTGYSSLTYLKRLPVAQIKIDQSFVRDMFDDTDNLVILEAMVSLAAALNRQVIAEGVETVEHCQILLQVSCDLAQGYFIARPMPAHELPGWSAAWRPDPTWSNLPCVRHEDLPLLFASIDHRAGVDAIEKYLKGEREAPPPLDIYKSRFGQWLNTEGLARLGGQPNFQAIESLHQQMHALAAKLCTFQAQGRKQEALTRLGELHGLRDALFEQLKLAQENQH